MKCYLTLAEIVNYTVVVYNCQRKDINKKSVRKGRRISQLVTEAKGRLHPGYALKQLGIIISDIQHSPIGTFNKIATKLMNDAEYLCVSLVSFQREIRLFRLQIAVNSFVIFLRFLTHVLTVYSQAAAPLLETKDTLDFNNRDVLYNVDDRINILPRLIGLIYTSIC